MGDDSFMPRVVVSEENLASAIKKYVQLNMRNVRIAAINRSYQLAKSYWQHSKSESLRKRWETQMLETRLERSFLCISIHGRNRKSDQEELTRWQSCIIHLE